MSHNFAYGVTCSSFPALNAAYWRKDTMSINIYNTASKCNGFEKLTLRFVGRTTMATHSDTKKNSSHPADSQKVFVLASQREV